MNIIEIRLALSNKRAEVVSSIIDMGAADFAEYKYKLGMVHGLSQALLEIKQLEQQERNNSEDYDE